jgi:hypothetical protein
MSSIQERGEGNESLVLFCRYCRVTFFFKRSSMTAMTNNKPIVHILSLVQYQENIACKGTIGVLVQ